MRDRYCYLVPIEAPSKPPDDRRRQEQHGDKFEVFSVFRH
jgi:hypothetical protein